MERYDQLYRVYAEFDTGTLRAYQDFVDVFPPVDSRHVLHYWDDAHRKVRSRKAEIADAFPDAGRVLADVAAYATRDQAFTALDLLRKYERSVNVLVLDIDETLRSAGDTDNEIPRRTLHLISEFHERDVPIIVCTGQTLENVKGLLLQGLGNELVHSGDVSVVYEAGTGVFTPGHGSDTKQLLYRDLAADITSVFEYVRSRVLTDASDSVRESTHLQGNEFNVTIKPNAETGSAEARDVIDRSVVFLLDLLGDAVARHLDRNSDAAAGWARAHFAQSDPEIRGVLTDLEGYPEIDADTIPDEVARLLERIEVSYYAADAAEIGSRELNKVVGVETALDVLGIRDPFALVIGDSKSDLRVMEWAAANNAGIAAAPEHASRGVLEHVRDTDDVTFAPGRADESLRMAYALNALASYEAPGQGSDASSG